MEDQEATRPLSSDLRERIMDDVRRMVLWGEPKEAVLRKLEVNGIAGEAGAAAYSEAFAERVAVIHGFYRRKARLGLLAILGAGALMALCVFVFEGIKGRLWIIFGLLLGFGLWKFVDGFTGMLMAKNREGSVADLDA
jgi:hypothetical protein